MYCNRLYTVKHNISYFKYNFSCGKLIQDEYTLLAQFIARHTCIVLEMHISGIYYDKKTISERVRPKW